METKLQDLIQVFAEEQQEIENAANAMVHYWQKNNAVGTTLDDIGAFVGEPRNGSTDDVEYRARIKRRIVYNRSCGQINTLLGFIAAKGTFNYINFEEYPGVIYFYTDNAEVLAPLFVKNLQSMAVGGVRVEVAYAPAGKVFVYVEEEGDTPPAYGDGYADESIPGSGGIYSTDV